ncbi:cytochrome b5-related protein-like isoform X2 [Malaya genurostris]|nr:cytochrome b5-related protein-like isoform X2 [Malaya genurostris]
MVQTITAKYPTFRNLALKTGYLWLAGKRRDDGAEGLWRIHDTLYDLTEFADRHPGGADWIRLTQGTDITEAFETQHVRNHAEQLLPAYEIRRAQVPRNVRLTFSEQGFYRTLKRRVADRLSDLDQRPARISEFIQDSLLVTTFALAFAAVQLGSYLVVAACGLFLAWTIICAHNFFHRRDNWRMLIFNLTFFSYREWRISHVISHHLYTNSILDLEISYFEPFLCWLPDASQKNHFQRFGAWIYEPLIYVVMFFYELGKRLIDTLYYRSNTFYVEDLIGFVLPVFMYVTGSSSLKTVLTMWFFIVLLASFAFGTISINAAHHHPESVHSGDLIPKDIDFGIYQLATIIDCSESKGSQFKSLTRFGDHCLHHLFPTLDQGLLPQLYPVFYETCSEFQLKYREFPWWRLIIGQFQQLARIEPMTYVPSKMSSSH